MLSMPDHNPETTWPHRFAMHKPPPFVYSIFEWKHLRWSGVRNLCHSRFVFLPRRYLSGAVQFADSNLQQATYAEAFCPIPADHKNTIEHGVHNIAQDHPYK